MQLSGNAVLITGGASGIGLALAQRFLRAGSDVLVCGRRERALRAAQAAHPQLRTRACDASQPRPRAELVAWALGECPRLNVLVNNAGIQRRFRLTDPDEFEATREEIAINLEAPIHLCQLLAPHFLDLARQRTAPSASSASSAREAAPVPAIVNVTSGLAFTPLAAAPVYSATKAALHSFTLSLRHQLAGTGVDVIEVIPPAVNTDLGGAGLHTTGVPLGEFADAVMAQLARGESEVSYGFSAQASRASRDELSAIFARMNAPRAGSD
jgi:uncharacterized oxidoreductase